ncbi:sulfatase-like hydrolase/transferase [Bacillus sp. S14(2024)]|uniref:sulfatase-like hydrolase/transferase n=1 Tax=Bacillus sp. S14(2024) TaxID=3162884 RepID=UPI003D219141
MKTGLGSSDKKSALNVIYIVLDDVGYSALGCFGSEIETPNIDSLAKNGLRYNNFNVTPLCSPTRACF